jgi:hypothetical protein
MRSLPIDKEKLREILEQMYITDLKQLSYHLIHTFRPDTVFKLPAGIRKGTKPTANKMVLVGFLLHHLLDDKLRYAVYQGLTKNSDTKMLYEKLVWEQNSILVETLPEKLRVSPPSGGLYFSDIKENLTGLRFLITNVLHYVNYDSFVHYVTLHQSVRQFLRYIFPHPEDYYPFDITDTKPTKYSYSAESNVFRFLTIFEDLKKNKLLNYSKNGDKLLHSSLKTLKISAEMPEFFPAGKLAMMATEWLAMTLDAISSKLNSDEPKQDLFRKIITGLGQNSVWLPFHKLILTHLRGFGPTYIYSNISLFNFVSNFSFQIKDYQGWVTGEAVYRYFQYRTYAIYENMTYEFGRAYFESYRLKGASPVLYYPVRNYWESLFLKPMLKGIFFYLAALGLFELKFDFPVKGWDFAYKDEEYSTLWDGLRYLKLTGLGKYAFGFSETYTPDVLELSPSKFRYDPIEPLIILEKDDQINALRLAGFTKYLGKNRFALNSDIIMSGCLDKKELNAKILSFYEMIDENPPSHIRSFLNNIQNRADLLKLQKGLILFEMKKDPDLLALFMENKELRSMIIKAEAYRFLIPKEFVPKMVKILHENGFFITTRLLKHL